MRTRSWRELLLGSAVLAGCVLALVAVLVFARVGALHGATIRLYAATSQARGVMQGTDVVLSGLRVGEVVGVHFRPATVDTSARLVVAFDVLVSAREGLRRDSYAQIRTSGSLIGNPVVYLTPGSEASPRLADGDTVRAKPQGDLEGLTSRFAYASRDFPAIITSVKTLSAQLGGAQGTLGAFGTLTGDTRGSSVAVVSERFGRFAHATFSGDGTIGLALRDTTLAGRARQALQRADSLARTATTGGPLGRIRMDTAFLRSLQSTRDEVSIARHLIDEPRGTAGRVLRDRILIEQLRHAETQLADLIADAKRHPFRYAGF